MTRRNFSLLTGILLAYANSATAGWNCSIASAYPEVSSLSVENGKLIAILGTHFFDRKKEVEISGKTYEVFVQEFPRLEMSANGTWQNVGVVSAPETWNDSGRKCIDSTRDPDAVAQYFRPPMPLEQAEVDWFDKWTLSV